MRVLNNQEHSSDILEVFEKVKSDRSMLILWQVVEGKRNIHPIYIEQIEVESSHFTVSSAKVDPLSLADQVVFFFCKAQNFIFKSQLSSQDNIEAIISIPSEVKLLDDEDQAGMADLIDVFNEEKIFVEGEGRANQKFEEKMVAGSGEANINQEQYMVGRTATDKIDRFRSDSTATEKLSTKWAVKSMSAADTALFEEELSYITLEEEDKQYEGMRSAPRAKPPEGKMVTVQEQSGERPQGTYPLYDLSRGGISFLVFSKDEFNAGETLNVLAFDTKKFDEPMKALVRSVREADQLGVQFKVGCQFATEES